jgi:SAM-dependent methyltransferase
MQLRQALVLNESDTILAVCAGKDEKHLFLSTGLKHVVLTSLDPVMANNSMVPFSSQIADVRDLPFKAGEFDFVFVSDGLHHCDSPHAALVEMYRVARKGVIVFESRDSALMRLAVGRGFTEEYEVSAVAANGGECAGVNYTEVPNYVYRWTEREFEKVISCADPTGKPVVRFFYGLNAPARQYRGIKALVFRVGVGMASVLAKLFKKQSNSFCMVALKPTQLFGWLERKDGKIRFRGQPA